MKCPKCQADNREEVIFCEDCGAKLELACPDCGVSIPFGKKFCGKCGHNLGTSSSTQAPPVELSFEEKLENIQRYLPGGLTEKILAQRGKIEGERKQVTVMFCDTEGFSVLSEKLGPEKVYSLMDEVFETLIHKVNEFGGTVNKMTGDGVMALFGAPIALEDAPQRAIRSALAIQREIARFSDRIKAETGAPLRMRIGIHIGPVVVGSLGNDLRVEFTAVGDTVNLASRMEGLAEPGTVYVTEETFKLTEGLFRFEALGERQVKGKEAPVKAYRVIAPSTRRTRFDVSAERGLTPFRGRERELELLIDGLERARSGRGQAFSIMGEAGVGKSRLLYEFRKAIANEDVTFIEGRCLSYSTNVAYHPVIDLLKATFDIRDADYDNQIRDKVKTGLKGIGVDEASTLPFISEMLSVKASGIDALNLSPEARKDKTLEALKKIILKASETRPLVMAVEDLHWVDRSSEETFKDMLDVISGAQLLLIFTYRPEFVHTWAGKSYHNQVNLNRLSNRETLAMAAYILGTKVMGEDLQELILNKTEGIPFFVEEFIKSLKDLGMIEWRDSGYYLAKDIQDVAIPSTIQEVIMARVDSLPDGAKGVLQTGSAIGREFSCELIKRVTGIPMPEMTPHLSVLRDSELLYERGVFPRATYIFRHSLTQEVAYDSLLQKKKQEIHERIGQAIEELYADRLEEFYEILAYHYSRSESHEKAYRYLKLSGDKATRSNSPWEAFHSYKAAIDALNVLPDNEQRKRRGIEVRLSMLPSMSRLGYHPEDSLAIIQEGEKLCRELGDDMSRARLAGFMGVAYSFEGNTVQARKYHETAFQAAEGTDDIELLTQIGFTLCTSYSVDGEYSEVAKVAPKVIARLESSGREGEIETLGRANAYSLLLAYYGNALGMQGDFEQGSELCEKGLRFALQLNDPFTLSNVQLLIGTLFLIKGESQKATEHFESAIKYAEEVQSYYLLGLSWVFLGVVYYVLGELDTARKYMEKGLKVYQDIAMPDLMSQMTYGWLGVVYTDEGNLEAAKSYLEKSLKASQDRGSRSWEAWWSIWLVRTYNWAEVSEATQAEASLLHSIEVLGELEMKPWCAIAYSAIGELYADTSQKEKALETLKKAEGMMQEMGMDDWLRRTQEVLERVEG